jgi:sugar lactone lactonase YvrE
VCVRSTLSTLDILAGRPGGPGWVDGTLVAAHFMDPWAVRGDGQGHLYVADKNMIRAVDLAAGKVTTLAGAFGVVGYADGPGAQATFNLPSGLAIDGSNLYLTDTENHTIRKIDLTSADVSTIAGTPREPGLSDGTGGGASFREPEGIAVDGAGHLFVADTDNNTIREMDLATGAVTTIAGTPGMAGSTDGVGAAALFSKPKDLVFDGAGNLYVADALNESIRKVVVATAQVSTLATFNALPQGVGVDGTDVLVSLGNDTVMRIAPDGTTSTLAGTAGTAGFVDGAGSAALLDSPAGLWNDGSGRVYIADELNAVIRTLDRAGPTVATVVGAKSTGSADGAGTQARFSAPLGIAADTTSAYVADTGNHVIRKVDLASGKVTTLAGAVGQAAPTDGAFATARFNGPQGLALDASGQVLYVADSGNRSVRVLDLKAGRVSTVPLVPAPGGSFEGFDSPSGLALDQGTLYVTDYVDDVVVAIDLQSSAVSVFAGTYGAPGSTDGPGPGAGFDGPEGICADGKGSLFVADNLAQTIRKIDVATAVVSTLAGRTTMPGSSDGKGTAALFNSPVGVTVNALGDLFVSDSLNDLVRHVSTSTGVATTVIGTLSVPGVRLGALPAQITQPSALALTPTGALLVVSENTVLVAH